MEGGGREVEPRAKKPSGKTYKDVIYEGRDELKAGTGL